uniref:Peptidyl-prolyl cis-trans isomerase n=1 Tax=Chlamydomonas euryale TaxID=1486919 RepID=A0A7R9V6Y3_9CHLO|mmetsp:Transcript_2260/g.5989  ORF Transcript_2260/g.5989 Transcript_2260/m.5989 type:complete len:108 (+) Transcript_2260:703-1026(+)
MSIYGHPFKDDPGGLKLQHDRPYLLSIANSGHDTNTAHFSITCAPAHHLDGSYVIFGECVSGFDVIEAVNALSRGQRDNALLQSKRAQIVDAGQLRRGAYLAPPAEP